MDRDVVHPSLKRVLAVRWIGHELRNERIVTEEKVESLLLTREQGRVKIAKIIASLLRMLDGMQDEAILEPSRIVRIALTPLEGVFSRLWKDPEVGNAGAGMLRTLGAHPTVVHGHLQNRGP